MIVQWLPLKLTNDTFNFDILIYSEADSDWVSHVFDYDAMSKFGMEKEHGFKLVERRRDFAPGSIKMEKTSYSIEHSRRMIVILSRYIHKNCGDVSTLCYC